MTRSGARRSPTTSRYFGLTTPEPSAETRKKEKRWNGEVLQRRQGARQITVGQVFSLAGAPTHPRPRTDRYLALVAVGWE